jgi:hypothetical protein
LARRVQQATDTIPRIPAVLVNIYPPVRDEDSLQNGSPPVSPLPDLKPGLETWPVSGNFLLVL